MNIVSDIVVLDDDPTDLEITSRLCRDVVPTCLVHSLQDHAALEQTLQAVTPRVVLIDHYLGATVGTQVIQNLTEYYPGVAFVLVTGSMDQTVVCDALRAGAVDYINKDDLSVNSVAALIHRVAQKRQQQDDARATLSVLNDGIIKLNEQREIQRCNLAVEELLDESEEELIGRPLDTFLNTRDRKIVEAMFTLVGSDYEHPMEVTLVNKNEKQCVVEITVNGLSNGEDQTYVVVMRNISSTVQPLYMMHRHMVSVASSRDYLGSSHIDGQIQFLNSAAQQFFKVEISHPGNKPVNLQDLFAQSMHAELFRKIIPRVSSGGRWSGNGLLRTPDDRHVPVSIMMNGLRNPKGKVDTIVFAMREISSSRAGSTSLH